jgi:hypothetical protein
MSTSRAPSIEKTAAPRKRKLPFWLYLMLELISGVVTAVLN